MAIRILRNLAATITMTMLACGLACVVGATSAMAAGPEDAITPQKFLVNAASMMKVTECDTAKYYKHIESKTGTVWLALAYGSSWDSKPTRMEKLELKLTVRDKAKGDTLKTGDVIKVKLTHHDSEKKAAKLAQDTYTTKVMADTGQGIVIRLKIHVPAHYAAYKSTFRNPQWNTKGHRLSLTAYSRYLSDSLAASSFLPIGHRGDWHTEELKVQINLESCGIESQACDFAPLGSTGLKYAPDNAKLLDALSGSFDTSNGLNYSSSGEIGCAGAALFMKQEDTLKIVNKKTPDGLYGTLTYNGTNIKGGKSTTIANKACQKISKKIIAKTTEEVEFIGWKVTRTVVGEKVAGKTVKKKSSGKFNKTWSNKGGTAKYTFCNSTSQPTSHSYAWCSKCRSAFFFGCGNDASKWATKHTSHRDKVSVENHGKWSGSVTTLTATWKTTETGKIEYYLDGNKLTKTMDDELPTFYRCDVSGDEVAETADCEYETTVNNYAGIQSHIDSEHNHHTNGYLCTHTYSGYYCSYCSKYTESSHTHYVADGYYCSECGARHVSTCYHDYLSCTNTSSSHTHTASCYSEKDFATSRDYSYINYCRSATLYEHYKGNLGTPNTDYSCDKASDGCTWSFEEANTDGSTAAARHDQDYDYVAKTAYTKMYRTLSLEQAVSRAKSEGALAADAEVENDEKLVGAWYLDGDISRFGTYASREDAEIAMGLGTCQGHSSTPETECGHADGSGMAALSRNGGDELEASVWDVDNATLKLYAFTAVAVDGYADYAYIDTQYGTGEGVEDGVAAADAPGDSYIHTDWCVLGNTYKITDAMCDAAEAKRAGSCMDWADYVGEDYWFTDPVCSNDSEALDDDESDDDTDGSEATSSKFPAAGVTVDSPLDLFTRNKVQVSIDYSDNTASMASHMADLMEKDSSFNVYTLIDADGNANVVAGAEDFKRIVKGATGLMTSTRTGRSDILSYIRSKWMPVSAYGRTESSETATDQLRGLDDGHADGEGSGEFHWYGDIIDGSHLEAQTAGQDFYYLSSSGYVRKISYNGLFADSSASAESGPIKTGNSIPWGGSEGEGVESNTVLYMDWDDTVYDGIQGS